MVYVVSAIRQRIFIEQLIHTALPPNGPRPVAAEANGTHSYKSAPDAATNSHNKKLGGFKSKSVLGDVKTIISGFYFNNKRILID